MKASSCEPDSKILVYQSNEDGWALLGRSLEILNLNIARRLYVRQQTEGERIRA
jgi:hypothetical protein